MSGADRIEQLEMMRLGTEARFAVKCRGFSISLRPLTIAEENRVAVESQVALNEMPEHSQNRMYYDQFYTQKVLELASTSSPDNYDPKLTSLMVSRMTVEEVLHLWKQYIAGKDRLNPSLEALPVDEVKKLVAALKKSPSDVIEHSFLELVNVCQFLLNELPQDSLLGG
jgi:hypothetical protein